jgi:hypothetical protein
MQATTPPITFDPAARGPLHGVRILDLSRLVAGNMLSLQLADFGADVVKVEAPGGDPLRDRRDGGHELHWKVYYGAFATVTALRAREHGARGPRVKNGSPKSGGAARFRL